MKDRYFSAIVYERREAHRRDFCVCDGQMTLWILYWIHGNFRKDAQQEGLMVSQRIRKKFLDLSIIHQAVLTVFIGCTIFLIFFVSYIFQTNKVFEDANKAYAEDLVLQLEESIYSNYESLKNTIHYISFQTDLQNFLLEEDAAQKYVYFNRINQFWANMTSLNP